MPKEIENLIYYIDSLFIKRNNKTIKCEFKIIDGNIFFYTNINNGTEQESKDLKIQVVDLANLYMFLYPKLKEQYIDSKSKFINIIEERDLRFPDKPYLKVSISDVHKNDLNLYFRNPNDNQLVAVVLNEIKNDWISLIEEMRTNKNK